MDFCVLEHSEVVSVKLFVVTRPGVNLNFLLVDPILLNSSQVFEVLGIIKAILSLLFVRGINVCPKDIFRHDVLGLTFFVSVLHILLACVNEHVSDVVGVKNLHLSYHHVVPFDLVELIRIIFFCELIGHLH